jgi:hypothetical protein
MPEEDKQTLERPREPSQYDTAMMIADRLDEHDDKKRQYIVYLVRALGRTQARKLLRETLEGKEQGEMTVQDSEERPTPSEIYFQLVETRGKPKRDNVLKKLGEMETVEPEEQPGLPNPVEVAHKIAAQLHETGQAQVQQIMAIVRALGSVQAWALMMDAIQLDAGEGMMVPDGSRRRTVGGIFFYLVYSKGEPLPGKKLGRFPQWKAKSEQLAQPQAEQSPPQTSSVQEAPKPPQPAPLPPFTWQDRIAVIREAEKSKGTANVKITVIGRPGKIVDKGQCVVIVMESTRIPSLPKGLPTPPATPTKYTVYIGSKQWKKVADAIRDPEDSLIIEGFPTIDEQIGTIAVFATNTSTKKLQAAQRGKQQETTA